MTRPTEEQIKALRKGDVVTVRAVVLNPIPDKQGDLEFDVPTCGHFYAPGSDIATIEPREIKVGDRVTIRGPRHGFVKHIDGAYTFIAWEDGAYTAELAEILKVIP